MTNPILANPPIKITHPQHYDLAHYDHGFFTSYLAREKNFARLTEATLLLSRQHIKRQQDQDHYDLGPRVKTQQHLQQIADRVAPQVKELFHVSKLPPYDLNLLHRHVAEQSLAEQAAQLSKYMGGGSFLSAYLLHCLSTQGGLLAFETEPFLAAALFGLAMGLGTYLSQCHSNKEFLKSPEGQRYYDYMEKLCLKDHRSGTFFHKEQLILAKALPEKMVESIIAHELTHLIQHTIFGMEMTFSLAAPLIEGHAILTQRLYAQNHLQDNALQYVDEEDMVSLLRGAYDFICRLFKREPLPEIEEQRKLLPSHRSLDHFLGGAAFYLAEQKHGPDILNRFLKRDFAFLRE